MPTRCPLNALMVSSRANPGRKLAGRRHGAKTTLASERQRREGAVIAPLISRGSRLETAREFFPIRPENAVRRHRMLIGGIDPPQDIAFTRFSLPFPQSWTRSRGAAISVRPPWMVRLCSTEVSGGGNMIATYHTDVKKHLRSGRCCRRSPRIRHHIITPALTSQNVRRPAVRAVR